MEQLKSEKKEAFAVIAYHLRDDFIGPMNASSIRYQYYRPGSEGVPLGVIDGGSQFLGGIKGGNMYSYYLPAYQQAAATNPSVEVALELEGSDRVRVEVTNASWTTIQGTVHLALVERHKPLVWEDMNELDFLCRMMMPGPNGQYVTIPPSQVFTSTQQFSIQPDWNYCSIVAFFQTGDKKIAQGAMIDIEDSFPSIQMQDAPASGDLWLKGSAHNFSWSSSRPLSSVAFDYSTDGGSTWTQFQPQNVSGNTYSWTAPAVNSTKCLLSVRDPFGGSRVISGLFAIGIRGDLNSDGAVNAADRSLLVEHLTESKSALLPGLDLNQDGTVDLFDLIYFDSTFK